MELLRSIGASLPSPLLLDLARSLLSLLAMDRFGDFVGDIVIAPVRETAAQALGVLLKFLDYGAVLEVHDTLMGMIKQDWAKRGKAVDGLGRGEKFAWEVRHAGLLGVKYEVAVRGDLLGSVKAEHVKMEDVKVEVKEEEDAPPDVLQDVVAATILS